jgi:hypothetical protein
MLLYGIGLIGCATGIRSSIRYVHEHPDFLARIAYPEKIAQGYGMRFRVRPEPCRPVAAVHRLGS